MSCESDNNNEGQGRITSFPLDGIRKENLAYVRESGTIIFGRFYDLIRLDPEGIHLEPGLISMVLNDSRELYRRTDEEVGLYFEIKTLAHLEICQDCREIAKEEVAQKGEKFY